MILADTSIWIDHLRIDNPVMGECLLKEQIVQHPFVVAGLALGSLKNRKGVLKELDEMDSVQVAQLNEVRQKIEAHALYTRGIGLTDAHLIASCLLTPGTLLWTRDSNLARLAREFGIFSLPWSNKISHGK
jgi:predicted nucleic acid-binding protein